MTAALALIVVIVVGVAAARAAWRVAGWADVSTRPPAEAAPAVEVPAVGEVGAVGELAGAAAIAPARRAATAIVRRPARPAVVLVHGILGFDAIGVGRLRVHYFRRVAARLAADGFEPITVRLPPLAPVPVRAALLAQHLAALPHDRVTVLAHSMGGLDARWAIAQERAAARIERLITLGTPHRGTPIADLLARGPANRARAVLGRIGLASGAVDWLTTWRAAELARDASDVDGVAYASIVTATADRARVHPLLRPSHAYLARCAGPSDGLVPATSQRWGEVLVEAERDHWAQVGWSGRHDAAALVLASLGATPRRLPTAA